MTFYVKQISNTSAVIKTKVMTDIMSLRVPEPPNFKSLLAKISLGPPLKFRYPFEF